MPLLDWFYGFWAAVLSGPVYVAVWVGVLVVMNSLAFLFVTNKHAALVAGIWAGNALAMIITFGFLGYGRHLGAVHLFFWTPMLMYLWPRWKRYPERKPLHLWIRGLLVVDSVSWVLDLIDVIRVFS